MSCLMVIYDLNEPGQGYRKLLEYLKKGAYWDALGSVWFMVQGRNPLEVRGGLNAIVDINDKVDVVDVSRDRAARHGFNLKDHSWFLREKS